MIINIIFIDYYLQKVQWSLIEKLQTMTKLGGLIDQHINEETITNKEGYEY